MSRMIRGIGLRAAILMIAVIVVGFWLLSIASDVIGGLIRIAVAVVLVVIGIAAFAIAGRKFKRRP